MDAKHLVERVSHDRAAKPRGNVFDRRAVALRLAHLRIHEDRAAGAKVAGVLGVESGFHEIRERQMELLREGLQERAAPGRACFVELHACNEAVLHFEALDVLAANVDDVAHLRLKSDGRALMRERFNFGELSAERRLREVCAVARRAERAQERAFRHFFGQRADLRVKALKRIALVEFVPAVGKPPLAVDDGALDCG